MCGFCNELTVLSCFFCNVCFRSTEPCRASVDSFSPLKEQLNKGVGGGEGSVRREEDGREVWLLVFWVQQVGDQTLQSGCLQPACLYRVVLDEAKGCGWLGGRVWGRVWGFRTWQYRLPAQCDAKDCSVLLLLPPLLYWILRENNARTSTSTRVKQKHRPQICMSVFSLWQNPVNIPRIVMSQCFGINWLIVWRMVLLSFKALQKLPILASRSDHN